MQSDTEWEPARTAWSKFSKKNFPILGYGDSPTHFYNFMRHHKGALVNADAIRKVKHRHWIAHRERFAEVAFACATGAV